MNRKMALGELIGRVLRMSTPGVTLGALALAPYLLGAGADATGAIAGVLGWAVPVVVTLALLVLAINDVNEGNGAAYTDGASSYATFIAVNMAATGLACATFWVIVFGASGFLAAPAGAALAMAVATGLSLTSSVILVAISIVGAVAVTAWADAQAGE